MTEVWKPIDGYEGIYEISDFGRVRSLARIVKHSSGAPLRKRERILKPLREHHDGRAVQLYRSGAFIRVKVHRLVAQHFIANPDNLPEVNHKDFDRSNNLATNLEWSTHDENIRHSARAGRYCAAISPRRARKLTPSLVRAIRVACRSGLSYSKVAKQFGIGIAMPGKIMRGERWKIVTDTPPA